MLEGDALRRAVAEALGWLQVNDGHGVNADGKLEPLPDYATDWNTVREIPFTPGQFPSVARIGDMWEAVLGTNANEVSACHVELSTAFWNAWLIYRVRCKGN